SVEGLAKLHDVDTPLTQSRSNRRAWICLARRYLKFDLADNLLRHYIYPLCLVPLYLNKLQLHRRSSPKNDKQPPELAFVRLPFPTHPVEFGKRTISYINFFSLRKENAG